MRPDCRATVGSPDTMLGELNRTAFPPAAGMRHNEGFPLAGPPSKRISRPSAIQSKPPMSQTAGVIGLASPAATCWPFKGITITFELKILVLRTKATERASGEIAGEMSWPSPGLESSWGSPPSDETMERPERIPLNTRKLPSFDQTTSYGGAPPWTAEILLGEPPSAGIMYSPSGRKNARRLPSGDHATFPNGCAPASLRGFPPPVNCTYSSNLGFFSPLHIKATCFPSGDSEGRKARPVNVRGRKVHGSGVFGPDRRKTAPVISAPKTNAVAAHHQRNRLGFCSADSAWSARPGTVSTKSSTR